MFTHNIKFSFFYFDYIRKYKNFVSMNASKNHTTSKFTAKAVLRLILILMLAPVFFYLSQDKAQLLGHVVFPNKLALIAPLMLLLIFVVLLILVLKNKYQKIDLNWLFVLNGIFLILYLILLFTRIFPIL